MLPGSGDRRHGRPAVTAHASDNPAPSGGGKPLVAAVQHRPPSSSDWLRNGVGSGGARDERRQKAHR